jgi:hypothetical protein
MFTAIILMILGLSAIALGLTYALRRKRYFYIPTIILLGVGVIMIGISFIPGIKDTWSDTILVVFGMIFIFASLLTALTITFMKFTVKRRG